MCKVIKSNRYYFINRGLAHNLILKNKYIQYILKFSNKIQIYTDLECNLIKHNTYKKSIYIYIVKITINGKVNG